MILNKVVLSNGFGSIIHIGDVDGRTNSSVNIYHDYRLVYEIEGVDKTPAEMTFAGAELLATMRHATEIVEAFDGDSDSEHVRQRCQLITTVWARLRIDNSKSVRDKLLLEFGSDVCRLVKKALKGDVESMSIVKAMIGGYVFLSRECADPFGKLSENQNTLHVLEIPSVPENSEMLSALIELHKDESWQDQPIAKRLGLTSFEEVKTLMKQGVLIPSWISDFSHKPNFTTQQILAATN